MNKNQEMTVFVKAKDLIEYTFAMTGNAKRFPKKTRFTFVDRMQNIALDIYSNLLKTNELPVSQRKELQIGILSDIKILLFLVELSNRKGYVGSKQCTIWAKKILDVKHLTAAWMARTK
jgi:hypothetical protein